MRLANDGDPALLKAMGVDGVVLGCAPGVYGDELGTVITPENVDQFGRQAREARDHGLVCECVYPDWNLIEKTIDNPGYLDTAKSLFDELSKHGLRDLFVSCGLRNLDTLLPAERKTYEMRFVEHLARLYEHADALGLHLCLHSSLMPWIYLRDIDAWDHWLGDCSSEANSMILCLGCTESAGLDAVELIERWHRRIRAVHVRNIVGRFKNRSHKDVRLDSGTLDLPRVFWKLADVDFQGSIIPEHFPAFPCQGGSLAGKAFSVGYCRGLIQAFRRDSDDGQGPANE